MFDVPAARPARRAPPWRWHLPLILSALAILGSAGSPVMYKQTIISKSCNSFDCLILNDLHPVIGMETPYGRHLVAMGIVLALFGLGLAKQRRQSIEGLKLILLGALGWWHIVVYRAIQQLRRPPPTMPYASADWLQGYGLFIAGMVLLGIGFVLAAARLIWPGRQPPETPSPAALALAPAADPVGPRHPRQHLADRAAAKPIRPIRQRHIPDD